MIDLYCSLVTYNIIIIEELPSLVLRLGPLLDLAILVLQIAIYDLDVSVLLRFHERVILNILIDDTVIVEGL